MTMYCSKFLRSKTTIECYTLTGYKIITKGEKNRVPTAEKYNLRFYFPRPILRKVATRTIYTVCFPPETKYCSLRADKCFLKFEIARKINTHRFAQFFLRRTKTVSHNKCWQRGELKLFTFLWLHERYKFDLKFEWQKWRVSSGTKFFRFVFSVRKRGWLSCSNGTVYENLEKPVRTSKCGMICLIQWRPRRTGKVVASSENRQKTLLSFWRSTR